MLPEEHVAGIKQQHRCVVVGTYTGDKSRFFGQTAHSASFSAAGRKFSQVVVAVDNAKRLCVQRLRQQPKAKDEKQGEQDGMAAVTVCFLCCHAVRLVV